MNKLNEEEQTRIIASLIEGNSIRATVRMTGAAKRTVLRLLVEVGEACRDFQRDNIRNLPCEKIQCDEIWSFCGMKEKNVPEALQGKFGFGDIYTWVALCPDCKLVPAYLVGRRDPFSANLFVKKLARCINHKVQITTDGYAAYRDPMINHFGNRADYSQLVKIYGSSGKDSSGEVRYSPPECLGTKKRTVFGNPDPAHVSTSLIERQNLTMRMGMRRFTRLTNAFSKKISNLQAAVALHFMYYNFCRIHQSLRCTPAMKAKITDRVWEIKDILSMVNSK